MLAKKANRTQHGEDTVRACAIGRILGYLAEMRGKGAMISRLPDTEARTRTWLKTVNIAGLPFLVALVGLLVWLGRKARGRRIKAVFAAAAAEAGTPDGGRRK